MLNRRKNDSKYWNNPLIETIVDGVSYKLNRRVEIYGPNGHAMIFNPIFSHELKDAGSHMTESFVFWKILRKKTVGKRYINIDWDLT